MAGYGQRVLVRADRHEVERALEARMAGWELYRDQAELDVREARFGIAGLDDMASAEVRTMRVTEGDGWTSIDDEYVARFEEPVAVFARELSRASSAPVLAIGWGDEGLGLAVYVEGDDVARWASDGGDDARLDRTRPFTEWHGEPEALTAHLGDGCRAQLARLEATFDWDEAAQDLDAAILGERGRERPLWFLLAPDE